MTCPECGSEYVEGITRCADCDVDLEHPEENANSLVPLTRITEPLFLAELTDRLEKAQIPYVVNAGTGLDLIDNPASGELVAPYSWEARVWVLGERRDAALQLLAEAEKRHRNIPATRTQLCY